MGLTMYLKLIMSMIMAVMVETWEGILICQETTELEEVMIVTV